MMQMMPPLSFLFLSSRPSGPPLLFSLPSLSHSRVSLHGLDPSAFCHFNLLFPPSLPLNPLPSPLPSPLSPGQPPIAIP